MHFIIVILLFNIRTFCEAVNLDDNKTNDATITSETGTNVFDDSIQLPPITTIIDNSNISDIDNVSDKNPAVKIISKEQIKNSNASNLFDILKSNGVTIHSYGNNQKIAIRAFSDECVRVFVDGVCINNSQTGEVDLSIIDINTVEQIQINKSAQSALGVSCIQIKTSVGAMGPLKIFAQSDFLTYFNKKSPLDAITNKFSLMGGNKNTNIMGSVNATYSKGQFLYKDYNGDTATRHNNDLLGGGACVGVKTILPFGNLVVRDIFNIKKSSIAGLETSTTPGDERDLSNIVIFNIKVDGAYLASGDVLASWMCTKRKYFDDYSDSDHFLNDVHASGNLNLDVCDFFMQNIFTDLSFITLDSSDSGEHFIFSSTTTAESDFFLGPVTIKIPLSLVTQENCVVFVPKFITIFNTSNFSLAVSCVRLCTMPVIDDLYWRGGASFSGNKDLKAEDGVTGQLSIAFYNSADCGKNNFKSSGNQKGSNQFKDSDVANDPSEIANTNVANDQNHGLSRLNNVATSTSKSRVRNLSWNVSVSPFVTYYKDKIQWQQIDNKWQPRNITSALFTGVDLEIFFNLYGIATIRGNFGYLYTRFIGGNLNGRHIMWAPDFNGSLAADINLNKVFFTIESTYIGNRYTSNENLLTMDSVFLIDAMVEVCAIPHFTPYVKLNNIGNFDWKSIPDYPRERLSLTVGVKYYSR